MQTGQSPAAEFAPALCLRSRELANVSKMRGRACQPAAGRAEGRGQTRGVRAARGQRRTRSRMGAESWHMGWQSNNRRKMRQCKGQWRDQQLAMRPGSNRGRPWRRGHLGEQDGLAALERETRALYEWFDDRTSTRAVQQRVARGAAADSAGALCGQGHRPSLCLVRSPRPLLCRATRVDRVHAA